MNTPRPSVRSVCGALSVSVAFATVFAASSRALAQSPPSEFLPAPPADAAPAITPPYSVSPEFAPQLPSGPEEYWSATSPNGDLQVPPQDIPTLEPPLMDVAIAANPAESAPVDFFGYDATRGQSSWLLGHDDRFGIVSLESLASLQPGETRGAVGGFGVHFLDGPIVTDMPARLFDFTIGYQVRRWIAPNFGVDLVGRIGAFSDFEGSAREGVRYPSHAVTFTRINSAWELLFGVDYLDRDDVGLLPVFGAVWTPTEHVRIDAVFPRPCAAVQAGETNEWFYVRGQLGGGTWAIERVPSLADDNATYRDLRLIFGLETRDTDVIWSAIEIGYVFSRQLSYRSSPTEFDFGDAVMINFTNTY